LGEDGFYVTPGLHRKNEIEEEVEFKN